MCHGLPSGRLSTVILLFAKSTDDSVLVRPGGKEKDMVILFLITLAFVVLAPAAYRWGANSSDGVNSSEWQRRQHWFGFH
jgi:hypothetical protein